MFDIADIYNAAGRKLAESMTPEGAVVESLLSKHVAPNYTVSSYEAIRLPDRLVLRVFVPLREQGSEQVTGYFEGVRVVPEWQKQQIFYNSISIAAIVCLAALLCGAVLYPVIVRLSADNERKSKEVLDSHISMMEALGRAIAKRDSDTGSHNYRVAWIASLIAEKIGLTGKDMQALIAGSFLHDVGKIGIPDAILLKPGKLDDEEFAIMRTHVLQGEEIVTGMGTHAKLGSDAIAQAELDAAGQVEFLALAKEIAHHHHEKWNGSGYPRQLAGRDIPLAARIFAVADVFDALCSKRPYKAPMPFAEAMAILEKDTGSHFDPEIMAVFRNLARSIHDRLSDTSEDDVRNLLEARVREYFEK